MAHLFPYRTQKLSISAAIVAMRDIVRVARCQVFFLLYFIIKKYRYYKYFVIIFINLYYFMYEY